MAQKERSNRGWWVVLVAIVAASSLYLYYRAHHDAVIVHAAPVVRQDIRSTVATNGKVEPIEDYQAHAPFSGIVEEISVDQGDHVAEGQELVRMDDSGVRKDLAASQAQLDSAQAQLDAMHKGGTQDELLSNSNDLAVAQLQQRSAAASLASLEKLQQQGAASANEVATAQQHLSDANLRVKLLESRRSGRYSADDLRAQQAQVNQAKAAVAAAQKALSQTVQRSPFAGTVYSVPVSQYDFVQMGDTLMDVANLQKLQIRAYFDEPDIGNLAAGQPVKIVWEAKQGVVWHGHVVQAPTTIIQYMGTRNVGECLITVDDAKGDLLPNTNVTVTVTTQNVVNALVVPREALQTDGNKNFVYKIANGVLVQTPVKIGVMNLTNVQILSGLAEGDQVALGSASEVELRPGLQVKVQ
jgi:HlyD family secretion protein